MRESIYISIPISGLSESVQRAKAGMVAQMLREMGYEKVINPFIISDWLKNSMKREPTYDEYLDADIAVLRGCTAIYMCEGWSKSNGCKIERQEAINAGLEVIYEYGY